MSEANITGACFCGAISYRIDGGLQKARSCHCSRCRRAFGSAASAYAELAPDSTLTWESGNDQLSVLETSPGWGFGFCSGCGSLLCGLHDGDVHGVTLGCVDGDPGVEIEMHLFVESKAPWDHIGGDAPQYAEFPPGGL